MFRDLVWSLYEGPYSFILPFVSLFFSFKPVRQYSFSPAQTRQVFNEAGLSLVFSYFFLQRFASAHLALLNAWKGGSVVRNVLKVLLERLV